MEIKSIFGTTETKIQSKSHNPFFGISVNNRYFTKESIEAYLKWMLLIAKEAILVIIADDTQAINEEVFSRLTAGEALLKARKKGMEVEQKVLAALRNVSDDERIKISIVHWQDLKSSILDEKLMELQKEYKDDSAFRGYILRHVTTNLGSRSDSMSEQELDRLSDYLLSEIALVLTEIQYGGQEYDLNPYPGVTTSQMFYELQEGALFPKIAPGTSVKKSCFVEAYSD